MAEEFASQIVNGETEKLFQRNARRTEDVESFKCSGGTRLRFQSFELHLFGWRYARLEADAEDAWEPSGSDFTICRLHRDDPLHDGNRLIMFHYPPVGLEHKVFSQTMWS